MSLPDRTARSRMFPARTLLRIAAVGLAVALTVTLAGLGFQLARLGADDAAARRRIESHVRASFENMARELAAMAERVSESGAVAAGENDTRAADRLFFAVESAIAGANGDVALTVYAPEGRPIAWGGRPSDVPPARIQAGEAWFVAPGALGLRLIYVTPVQDDALRLGAIVAERSLSVTAAGAGDRSRGWQGPRQDAFRIVTGLVPVSVELPFEGARTQADPGAFEVITPSGERLMTASVASADIAATRRRWHQATLSFALILIAGTALLMAGPLLDWRNATRSTRVYVVAVILVAAAVTVGRILLRIASPADWSDASVFSGAAYASPLVPPLLASPFDFLMTAATAAGLVGLAAFAVEAWRLHLWKRRRSLATGSALWTYVVSQTAAGGAVAVVLLGHEAFLRNTLANTTVDLLHFSLHPWESARIALQIGLVLAHTTALGVAVLVLRAARAPWRVPRRDWRARALTIACWTLPLLVTTAVITRTTGRLAPLLVALAVTVALTLFATRVQARYRHGSQAFRLTLLTVGLVVPAFAFYPTLFALAWEAKAQLVESRYAPQAVNQRQTVLMQLERSLEQIDRFPSLAEVIAAAAPAGASEADRAFSVWQTTALAEYPATSSIELYGPDGALISRFAFNLPEDLTEVPRSQESSCDWEVYGEVAAFFADERRQLHAGRLLCSAEPNAAPLGSIVVHVIRDYENLPFIAASGPYVELLRPADPMRGEGVSGRDVEYAVYGWSRTPLYASGDRAWTLDDEVFARVAESRLPFWAELRRGDDAYDVFLLNDRGEIYALGFPIVTAFGHLMNLAEVTVLAVCTYVLLLAVNGVFGWVSRRGTTAPALLREVRASFYRKLFLAFVAAVFMPVAALALLTRFYVAEELRASVEGEAVRTASAARRVVEDLVAPRAAAEGLNVDDNLMVWVSRLIDQDVNIFAGPRLIATSERNLFASGVLPTRTHADVYHALAIRSEAATVAREQIGGFEYLVAGTPLTIAWSESLLTVPLTSRQRDIDAQIDTLDRRVLLGALLFLLAGAGLGYSMAERISDPVNRLTRATRRIARGDLEARILVSSSDELRRLVEDFNSMAAELQRQRKELERTHRLEAWAEMARQVAHEIKNPLTPIQLTAEHLRRVHADRGEPLGPIVRDCIGTILGQVRLLRQIASEFSSFASSPVARRTDVDLAGLLRDLIDPYRTGLEGRIAFKVDVQEPLPLVHVDPTLVSRSLTNIVENALHAMPGTGALAVSAWTDGDSVIVRVADTGVGMDQEALARAFEPYFSTKASGTGLGLPIAKRNIELSGGTIAVISERNKGTTVDLRLPISKDDAHALESDAQAPGGDR